MLISPLPNLSEVTTFTRVMGEERNGMESQLPVGYRFHPTREELLTFYLQGLVRGDLHLAHQPCTIPEIDIYDYHPQDLPQVFHDESVIPPDDQVLKWWFFSPHTPDTARRVKRSTSSGYWKKTGDDEEVMAKDTATVIDYKKILVFHDKGRGKNGRRTNWVIHEYHLPKNDVGETHVLCRLKLKRDKQEDNSRERSNFRAFMRILFERKFSQRG